MSRDPIIVGIIDQRQELGAVVCKPARSAVVSSGLGSSAGRQMGAMFLPRTRGSRDHNVAGKSLAIRGQRNKVRPFGFACSDVHLLLCIGVPADLSAQPHPRITKTIVSTQTRTLSTGENMIAVASQGMMAPAAGGKGVYSHLCPP